MRENIPFIGGGSVASFAPEFNPVTTLLEDLVRAFEKGNSLAQSAATVDEALIQRTEDFILTKVSDITTNQILPQALRSCVELRIREIAIAHEKTGKRVDKLTEVADRHSALLQESSDSMGHISEMIRTSTSAQDDMKKMMETLLSMMGSNRRRKKKSSKLEQRQLNPGIE